MAETRDLRDRFLEAMSRLAATVTIVTTDGGAGRAGVTVSAISSVSADGPAPSLLVCINHQSSASGPILDNRVFCVNVLRDDQAWVSDRFAGRTLAAWGDKFAGARWTAMKTGAPRIVDPLVAFDCRLTHSERVGTHHVMFGAVADVYIAGDGLPLIYANRGYGALATLAAAEPRTA